MELNNIFIKDSLRDYHLFSIVLTIWIVLFSIFETSAQALGIVHLLMIVGAAATSLVLFKACESIGAFSIVQKDSDVFLMTSAFLTAAVSSDLLFRLIFLPHPADAAISLGMKILPLAIIILFGFGFTFMFLTRYERRKKIVLDLTADERSGLMAELAHLKLESHVEFLTVVDLKQYFQQGKLSEIDMIIISREAVRQFDSEAVLLRAHLAGVPIGDLQEVTCKITGHIQLSNTDLSTYLLGATQKTFIRRLVLHTKYFIEPFIALVMALAFLPLFAVVALLIKLMSPGPVLYRQKRTGYLGRQFKLIKFRTMVVDAERNGPQWSLPKDSRITPLGNFLRRTRLDELPQLWNVLMGEMSFFGPRPERPEMYEQLQAEVPLFTLRTLVRPGISGWAQVNAGYAASSAESLTKLEHDLFYIQHMSLRFDLYILFKTLKTAFVGDKSAARKKIGLEEAPQAIMQT